MKNNDLKINVLSTKYIVPDENNYKSIWINLYGVSIIEQKLITYLADIFEKNPNAKKLLINTSEKIKEELKVFSKVHGAKFIK